MNLFISSKKKDKVYLYSGVVKGTIVTFKCASGFVFDLFFMPDGATKTLSEEKLDKYNARVLAVKALIASEVYKELDPIFAWSGP